METENRQETISWEGLEFFEKRRSSDWYYAVSIIGISISITALIMNNILFAIFVIFALIALMMHGKIKPRILKIEIQKEGVKVGDNFWDNETLNSFWIENIPKPRIIFGTKSIMNPTFYIPIPENINQNKIKKILEEANIEEKETEETLSEKIMEYFGF